MMQRFAVHSVSLATLLLVALASTSVTARPTGEPQPCGNCHYEDDGPNIDVAFANASPAPGATTLLTITLQAVDEQALRTGVFIYTEDRGAFGLVEPETTRYATDGDPTAVLHSAPRELDAEGRAQFQFEWTAPAEVGVTDFTVWSITGNSNGNSADDHHATLRVGVAHGCDGTLYYPDLDGDGFGDAAAAQLSCEPIAGMITQGGDCNDGDATIRPGAVELCNTRDDDCDGNMDDGLEPGIYYLDIDGDGYAGDREQPEYTCNDTEGYTQDRGDCEPEDPAVYPGAPELDNGRDDDCDGEVDEVDETDPTSGGSGSEGSGSSDALPGAADGEGDAGGCRVDPSGGRAWAPAWSLVLVTAAWLRRRRRGASTV